MNYFAFQYAFFWCFTISRVTTNQNALSEIQMDHNRLLFCGKRFLDHGRALVGGFSGTEVIFSDAPSRPWNADASTAGLWRTFSETDLSNSHAIAGWLRLYGDIAASTLDPPTQRHHHVGEWQALHAALKTVSAAWCERRPNDDRDYMADPNSLHHQEAVFALGQLPLLPPKLTLQSDGTLLCHSLGDYLFASAALMLREAPPLRTCEQCKRWFPASHARSRFCSPRCRIASHREQGDRDNG